MLSDAKIKSLKPKDKRYKISDGENLYIQVMPTGTKTWIFEYKDKNTNKYKRITLGKYPAFSLINARLKRAQFQKDIAEGKDLAKENENIKIFDEVFEEWIKLKKIHVSEKSILRYKAYNINVLKPRIGNKNIKLIDKSDIVSCLEPSIFKEQFEATNKLIHLLNMIFKFSITKDYTDINIMQKIDKKTLFTQQKNHYPAFFEKDKIKALIDNIENYDGNQSTKVAALLTLYTAQRSGSVRAAKWEEFDFNTKLWIIPAKNMKMKSEHLVPLSNEILDILKEYKKLSVGSDFLFPSVLDKKRPMSDGTVRTMLRRLGYSKDELTTHGFRSMFSTICYENRKLHNIDTDIIELCLDHIERNKVKMAYNRSKNIDERTKLMQWWSDWLNS